MAHGLFREGLFSDRIFCDQRMFFKISCFSRDGIFEKELFQQVLPYSWVSFQKGAVFEE